MKIREGNTFTKQPFLSPSTECVEIRKEKRRLHRLMNPKNPGTEELDDITLSYRCTMRDIRTGRHTYRQMLKDMKDGKIKYFTPRKHKSKQRVCPRLLDKKPHVNKKPSKPSMFNSNGITMRSCGWKPNTPNIPRRVKREQMRRWIKNHRGKETDLSCKERRIIKNREMRKARQLNGFANWLELRNNSKDKFGERLCYCGHTKYCSCADPDYTLFKESIKRKTIIPGDPNNGWKEIEIKEIS